MLLNIKNLRVYYKTLQGYTRILDNIDLSVDKGEVIGIVGESGSGKSTLGHTLATVLPPNAIVRGEIYLDNVNITELKENDLEKIRGKEVFMIFQNPLNSLDPVRNVKDQLVETVITRSLKGGEKVSAKEAQKEVIDVLKDLRIPDPETIINRYPHQLSGGQVQRMVIAMALLLKPKLIIADEPTSALDVTIQAQVVNILKRINEELGTTIMFITHDISLAYVISTRIIVMYAGRIMEDGDVEKVIKSPLHPYTSGLISSIPTKTKNEGKLLTIPGNPPSFFTLPAGCKFSPRCPKVMDICKKDEPKIIEKDERNVRCWLYG
ncbi:MULTISPECIES: ABC transporter ATP-binding protein [Acidianus]|uniref:Peptide ABC transporter ATP-binding protein n=1 Tax=Candidatus Acidianus copahuensis TaxID=1160895 RepID=A0A031LP01_9CREN|nr:MULTISPECIES: ABC transporter ATP-binding protein [Acidianus]EZQ04894.1 peptide ABC transporter ATP-binding protein [Candidatus Acidianus copahuensis]NON62036.1 ABC transporter ATP-binding protein [Acidianus sp. RZ1]